MVKNMKLSKDIFDVKIHNNDVIKGMNNTSFCLYINEYFHKIKQNIVIVTPSLFEANNLFNDLSAINKNVLLFIIIILFSLVSQVFFL